GAEASELVARVEASAPPIVVTRPPTRAARATFVLALAMLVVAGGIAVYVGDSSDLGVLVRGGALVHGLVREGEWWRLVTCVFVHVGGVHLLLNLVGLWFLGRLAEDLFGSWRTACVFALAGVGGAVASYYASPAAMSAGASGGVFGLLGAVFVELTLHRRRHRAAWNRGVWGSLAVVTVAQLGFDYLSPIIDQWSHGVGLAIGAVAGALLSPHVRWARASLHVSRVIACAFAVAVVVAFLILGTRTSIAASLSREPFTARELGTVTITAPAGWDTTADGHLVFADGIIDLVADREAVDVAKYIDDGVQHARDENQGERVDIATATIIPLPAGWQGKELAITSTDPLGGEQRWLELVAAHSTGDGATVGVHLLLPESIARAATARLAALVASIR
ncbi:MAG TPA: rhomboid family intramembrane serine protease, partial [Kofleriaceae bacterium]|nr:rhomboid family intramembrane serine protease [Kofleriaceae bacterium]